MEASSKGIRTFLQTLSEIPTAEEALLKFVRQLESDYHGVQDIAMFIFGMRCFFCWHRAPELLENPKTINSIRHKWVIDNDLSYTKWLSSTEDNHEHLKWAKWTFQAKNSILSEFIEASKHKPKAA
jgi:hypothetical protein